MCKEKLTKLINIMEVNKMLEVFLFNVTVGGLILSVAGMIGLELSENFKKEYKIVKRKRKWRFLFPLKCSLWLSRR